MTLLSWDLTSPLDFVIGGELSFNLHFEAPANTTAKKFYIVGGLYTDTTYIPGSLFGILKVAEVDYGVNDVTYSSIWELEPDEVVELPCRFTFNQTNCLLALFLMRMVSDIPNLDSDEQIAQIQTQLTAPKTILEEIGNIFPYIAAAMTLVLVGLVVSGLFKKGD